MRAQAGIVRVRGQALDERKRRPAARPNPLRGRPTVASLLEDRNRYAQTGPWRLRRDSLPLPIGALLSYCRCFSLKLSDILPQT